MSDEPPFAFGFDPFQVVPYRRPANVRESETVDRFSGAVRHFLRPENGELSLLNEQDYFVWQMLDGSKSFSDLVNEFKARFSIDLTWQDLTGFISELLPLGLLEELDEAGARADTSGPENGGAATPMPHRISLTNAAKSPATAIRYPSHLGWRAVHVEPFARVIGDPDKWLRRLASIFWPVRRISWLLIPITYLSFLIIIKHAPQYVHDYHAVLLNIPWWPALYIAEHIMNAFTRVIEGMVICGYGGAVHQWRVRNGVGFLLRSFIDDSSLKTMPLRCQLWAHGSTLLARLAVFDFGTWLWICSRATYPIISNIGVFCSLYSFYSFLITTCPLINQEGNELFAAYTGHHDLRKRALQFLGIGLRGRMPTAMTESERWSMTFLALGMIIVSGLWLGHILIETDVVAVQSMRGLGGIIVLGIFVIGGTYFYSLKKFGRKMRAIYGNPQRQRTLSSRDNRSRVSRD